MIRSGALDATGRAELQAMVDRASAVLGTSMSAISIVFRDWQYLIAARGLKSGIYQRSTSFCGHAIMTPDDLMFVADATQDARFAGNPAVVDDEPGLRFYAGAPLLDAEGLPLGTLCVFDPEPRDALPPEQAAALRTMADQIVELFGRLTIIAEPPASIPVAM